MAQDDSVARAGRPASAEASTGADSEDRGAALRAGEQRFRREFGRAPFGMLAVSLAADQLNGYLAANDVFCQLTGYTRRELGHGEFLGDVHPEDQPAVEALVQQISSGQTDQIRADIRLVRKDGEILRVRLTGSVIKPPAGERYLAAFIEDATPAEQAQAEIARLEQELQQSRRLESLGQLVGGIGHDFNNLLTVIANYASLVRDEVSVAEATESATRWEPVRWDVEQIEDAADRAKRLIKHLLAFAQREEAEAELVDLGQRVGDVTRLLRDVLGEQVSLLTRQGNGLWAVQADPSLLEQVIMNVALNARDAMPTGGRLTIDTANVDTAKTGPVNRDAANLVAGRPAATELAELLPGRYVELRIADTGIGMDAATAERAFEPFFTTKSGDQAAGLGLSAVRRLVARAGGQVWLSSEPGRGTTVTVMLPAAPGSGSAATGSVPGQRSAVPEHAGTVLAVDDEPTIRDVVHRVLTSAGYRVITAASGQEALDLLENPGLTADLLLTDVVMPGMTGIVFAARVKELRPGIRVLFMSGYDRPGSGAEGWPDSATEVVGKPFSRAALLARVAQALAADQAEGEAEQQAPAAQPEPLVRVRRR